MILLDIDNTIAFTELTDEQRSCWGVNGGWVTSSVMFHDVTIATYVVKAIQESSDVYLLSTWGVFGQHLVDAFDLGCKVINYRDYSTEQGIDGKFQVVKSYGDQVYLWADDHIRSEHRTWCQDNGVLAIVPDPFFGLRLEDVHKFKK